MSVLPAVAVALSLGALFIAGCSGQDPATPPVEDDAATAPAAAPDTAAASSSTPSISAAAPTSPEPEAVRSAPPTPTDPAPTKPAPTKPAPPSTPPKSAGAPSGAAAAMAPMPGTVIRQTELKAEPAPGARALRTLAANTPVTVTARQGGWLQVTSGDARGWVRLLHVSSEPAAGASSARRELEAAARVATGRAGSGNVAVTTGIRGLDEEALREAKPDDEELERLESLGAQPADAQTHAKRRGLERRQVPYPPPPQSR